MSQQNNLPTLDKSVFYMISADDLRSVFREIYAEEQQRKEKAIAQHRETPTISRREAARMLNVSLSTLWRWDKDGYLNPVKIGSKAMYRASDIDKMLNRMRKGGAK